MRYLLAAAILLAAAPALAEPSDLVSRPLVLDEGQLDLRLSVEANLQSVRYAKPLSVSPDAWWGITPRWTIGLIHSDESLDQIDSSATFCLREGAIPSNCNKLYLGSGVDVRYAALTGQFAVAPRVRVVIRDTDPFKPAMTIGGLVRYQFSRFEILGDPYVRLPLANAALGNRAQLVLPIWLSAQPATGWLISLQTGYQADFAVLREGAYGPLGLAVTWRASPDIDVSAGGGWGSLLGLQHDVGHATALISADWRPHF